MLIQADIDSTRNWIAQEESILAQAKQRLAVKEAFVDKHQGVIRGIEPYCIHQWESEGVLFVQTHTLNQFTEAKMWLMERGFDKIQSITLTNHNAERGLLADLVCIKVEHDTHLDEERRNEWTEATFAMGDLKVVVLKRTFLSAKTLDKTVYDEWEYWTGLEIGIRAENLRIITTWESEETLEGIL